MLPEFDFRSGSHQPPQERKRLRSLAAPSVRQRREAIIRAPDLDRTLASPQTPSRRIDGEEMIGSIRRQCQRRVEPSGDSSQQAGNVAPIVSVGKNGE
jgi:hypothetical protein